IPENFGKTPDFVVDNLVSFFLKAGLHPSRWVKVVFCSKYPLAVHNAVCWHVSRAGVHGPTHHTGCNPPSQVVCDCTVARNTPPGDEFCYFMNVVREIMVSLFNRRHRAKRIGLFKFTPNS